MSEATVRNSALLAWLDVAGAPRGAAAQASALRGMAPDGDMELARFVSIVERIADHAGNRLLGWQVGLAFDLAGLGEVGAAVGCARTLGGALQRLTEYFCLIQDAADVRLECTGGCATLSYRILDPDIWPREQDALFTLGIFAKIIRAAVGADWREAEIMVESEGAGLRREGARVLGARLSCGAETNAIRFPAEWLDAPAAGAPASAPNHARLSREVALRRRRLGVATRVRLHIFQHLPETICGQDDIARAMGMSSRTLRRRLGEEGTSFQALLDECRMRLAAFEFRLRPHTSIAQTALRLGYSEHSTFTRAFQRWNGMPPRAYLRSLG